MPRSPDLWPRIKEGVATLISEDATLSTVSGGVKSQLLTDMSNVSFPHIAVTYDGLQERFLPGDTETVMVEYPVMVIIRQNEDPSKRHEKEDTYQSWRKALTDLFWQRSRADGAAIPGATEVYRVTVNPKPAIDHKAGWYPTLVSAIVVLCEAAESRY